MSRQDQAHVKVYQGNNQIQLPTSAFESITHALQAGDEWWEGETLYGSSCLLRLSSVTDVHFVTADTLALVEAENDEEKWRDKS